LVSLFCRRRAQYEPTMPMSGASDQASRRRASGEARERASTSGPEAAARGHATANGRDGSSYHANRENDGGRSGNKDRARPTTVEETPAKRVKSARGGAKTPGSVGRGAAETVKGDGATAQTPRVRPTNNQLLYRINFKWEHYEHAIPAHVRKALPKMTEACPSVTSAFLQTMRALDVAESQRLHNARNVLRLLSVNTRRTKVVALNAGTHRVPEELRRHQLSDSDGNDYSTNLDRNRYGNDNNYLFTVTKFNLQALELCPLLAQVQIIGTKGSADDVLLTADKADCTCGCNRKSSGHHWTVPEYVTPAQMPVNIPKSTLAAKDRSRKKSRQSISGALSESKRSSVTPDRATEDQHAGMGVLLDALTSVGGIPPSPAQPERTRHAPVMSPSRPVRGIRQVELDLGAINEDTAAAQEQIAQATERSVEQIPDDQLRNELHSAIIRSCELHMTASAAQTRQRKAHREVEEYKMLVERLEQLLRQSETAMHRAQIQIAKLKEDKQGGSAAVLTTENERIIQGSALMAQKLINMQQRVAELSSRFELMRDQNVPRTVVEELLRTEMAAHLETNRALLRAETSLAAYAAAEATCDEEVWRAQYIESAQRNLEKVAYSAAEEAANVTTFPQPMPAPKTAPERIAATPSYRRTSLSASTQTPAQQLKAPRGVKSIALMADAAANGSIDAVTLPPVTPVGTVKPIRHAFISPT